MVERTIPGATVFCDPRGIAVPGTAETRSRGNVLARYDAKVERGIEIGPHTTGPDWDGERPDHDHILWVMNQRPAEVELVT